MASAIGTGELLKDRYRLERTLGRGGMAAVWLGHDEVLDRPIAVKVLSDTIASDPGFVARFRREAQMAAGLSHPNLVGVYDFSEEGERPYLVMQFVPGETLGHRLERGEGVDCDQLAHELLDALAHIHEVGILHRDIKPANIVIEPSGTAKLIDFGIALPRDATALTSTGLILGTERYAAPEVMEGRPATERSDLYSCGIVLRMCQGQCSRALGTLVEALTEKDPRRRPVSAQQALELLEEPGAVEQTTQAFEPSFTQRREPVPAPVAPQAPPPARAHSTSHRSRRAAVAAILGVIAALVIAGMLALGGDDGGDGGAKQAAQANNAKENPQGDGKEADGAAAAPVEQPVPSEEEASGSETEGAEESPEPAETGGTEVTTAPEGGDPATGAALNEEGFALIQAGEYEAAVPVLEEAVGSFPEGSEDLNYAYALFNLGNALRLSGRPEEAIPVLERRLEIPNQEGEVRKELEAAEAEAG